MKVWVTLTVKDRQRRFCAVFGDDDEVRLIRERKSYGSDPYNGLWDAPYWHAAHHEAGPGTIPAQIIEAAKAKRRVAS